MNLIEQKKRKKKNKGRLKSMRSLHLERVKRDVQIILVKTLALLRRTFNDSREYVKLADGCLRSPLNRILNQMYFYYGVHWCLFLTLYVPPPFS